ncbi:hypothetical protein FRC03_004162 [Tulasnella sp. 419]|nr:hypothetical protein FRC03_004162 [Tulasnella sp. 419]
MSSGVQRSRRSNASLTQKPYAGYQTRPKPKPKRQQSGFLDGLKSIVAGPLAWLSGIGKEGDEDEDEAQETGMAMGSKRANVTSGGAGGPPKKKARRSSPPLPAVSPLAPSNSRTKDPGGYLDPPMLKNSTMVSSESAPIGPRLLFNTLGRPNADSQAESSSFPAFNDRGFVPPQSFAPTPLGSRFPARTERTPESYGLVSQSPFSKATNLPPASIVSPNSGIRRTASAAFNLNKQAAPLFGRNNAVQQDSLTPSWSLDPMRSPHRQLTHNTQHPRLSKSPSVTDGRNGLLVSGRTDGSSEPEQNQHHISLAFGSTRRFPYPQYGGIKKSTSPVKNPILGNDKGLGSLVRRSSSLMNLDQPGTTTSGLERRRSSQMVFDKTMGITTIEEVEAQKPAPRAPRNNAERILIALEQATPLTEARKLRLKQKEAVRVPAPSPYARPTTLFGQGKSKKNARGADADGAEDQANIGGGALRKYLDSGRKERLPTKEEKIAAVKKAKEEKEREAKQMEQNGEDEDMDKEEPNVEVEGKGKAKEMRDEMIQVDGRSTSSMSNSPAPARSSMPGRNTSSLRAGREKTFRSHAPSSRPTNRFSAKFDDEDDVDAMEEEKSESASLTAEELAKWSSRGGGTLEIPAGFKFTEAPKTVKVPSDKEKKAELLKKLSSAPAPAPKTISGPLALPKPPSTPFTFGGVTPAKFTSFAGGAPQTQSLSQTPEDEQPPRRYPASLSKTPINKPLAPPSSVPTLIASISQIPKPIIEAPPVVATPEKVEEPKGDAPVKTLPFSFGSFGTPKPPASTTPAFVLTAPTPESKAINVGENKESSVKSLFGGFGSQNTEKKETTASAAPSNGTSLFSFGNAAAKPPATTPSFSFGAPANGGFSFGTTPPASDSSKSTSVAPPSSTPAPAAAEAPVRSSAPSPSPFVGFGTQPTGATPMPAAEPSKASSVATPAMQVPSSGFPFPSTQPPATPTFAPGSAPSTPVVQPAAVPPAVPALTITQPATEAKPAPLFGSAGENKSAFVFGSQAAASSSGTTSSPFSFGSGATAPSVTTPAFGSSTSNPFSGVGATPSVSSNPPTANGTTAANGITPSPATGTAPAAVAAASPFSFSNLSSAPKPAESKPFSFSFGSTPSSNAPATNGTSTGSMFKFGASSNATAAPASPFNAPSALPAASSSPFSFAPKPKTPPPQMQSDMMDDSSPTREIAPPSAAPSTTSFHFGSSTTVAAPTTAPTTPFAFTFGPSVNNPFASATTPTAVPGSGFNFGSSAPAAPQTPTANGFGNLTAPPAHPSPFNSQPNSPFQSPSTPFKTLNPAPTPTFGAGNAAAPNPFGTAPPTPSTNFSFSNVTSPPQANAGSQPVFVFGAGQPSSPSVATSERPMARLPRRAGSQSATRRPPPRR